MKQLKNVLELNRLPKAGQVKLNFKRTTPGSYARLFLPRGAVLSNDVIDPSHPWAKLHPQSYRKFLPTFRSSKLSIHAFPKALLLKPEHPHPDPPFTPTVYRSSNDKARDEIVDISMMMNVPKTQAKSSFIRSTLRKKLKFAFELIVKRGAKIEKDHAGADVLVEGPPDKSIAMPNWTYVMYPTMEIYKMSYADIVKLLRSSMPQLNQVAQKLEKDWHNGALPGDTRERGSLKNSKSNRSGRPAGFGLKGETRKAEEKDEKEQNSKALLEDLKRILNSAKEASEVDEGDKNKFQRRETTADKFSFSGDSILLAEKTKAYLDHFKKPTAKEKASITMNVLKEHRIAPIIGPTSWEQEQGRERRVNTRGRGHSR